ncbi:MAG: hypothetical protein JWR55_195 [Aeromicrobium sp.]|jgi:hypothetical protein|nr:hypothetical protein [Aeromicrobium sp.]
MPTSPQSHPVQSHPVRTLLLIVAAIAAVLALRAATADKGGSYDPAGGTR